jgi:hypothetical protein
VLVLKSPGFLSGEQELRQLHFVEGYRAACALIVRAFEIYSPVN